MSVARALQGMWRLLVEEDPYSTETFTLLNFSGRRLFDPDGECAYCAIKGETLTAQLANNVTLIVNPDDSEAGTPAPNLPEDVQRVYALVQTSFDDGSGDLFEYAVLVREKTMEKPE